jgi:hypothetical protein
MYEPPALSVLGSLQELTLTGGGGDWCILGKTLGAPDYWLRIPITNCSP